MTQAISRYLTSLDDVEWQNANDFDFPNLEVSQWLCEQGSLSKRLAQQCQHLSVVVLAQQHVSAQTLSKDETLAIGAHSCLLREVILQGDGQPWVIGRTLIPEPTWQHQSVDLRSQGDIPLGLTVFAAEAVKRDRLEIGCVEHQGERLFVRRSRLWMNHKPMLVTELFLPQAPIEQRVMDDAEGRVSVSHRTMPLGQQSTE
ncbi:chorismate lyase [Vibrio sp. SM6]|uniref:Probable chorismate pyruvate-lyase n=1 Tax=Vibrio agarilyticus TaxID=2726741 RepID=A0A7X8YHD7_9VIBR|nr:chorismate lyase [Vibrio agarilyticus]NLS13629.1 chorismate lyase [Vibrio agarilyticus]